MDLETPKDDRLTLLQDFAKITIEIFRTHDEMDAGVIKKDKKNPLVEHASAYLKTIKASNAKFDVHKKPYLQIYEKNRIAIHKTADNVAWLNSNVIEIKLAPKCCLKISSCYDKAQKIRKMLDRRLTGNVNTDDDIKNQFEYHYVDELLHKFLLIIRNSLDSDNRDIKNINTVINILEERAGLGEESSSEAEEKNKKRTDSANNIVDGLKKMLPNADGNDLNGGGFLGILNDVFGNEEITGQIGSAIQGLNNVFEKPSDSNNPKDLIGDIFDSIKPAMATTLSSITKNKPPPGVTVTSEGDELAKKQAKDAKEKIASLGVELDDEEESD